MINRVVLVGRLTRDPELRYTESGIAVATFTIAVNRTFTGASGEREADFIQCVVWRKQAENVNQYVGKGSLVGVEGRIQTRSYDDATGNKRYVTEVVCDSVQFLEPRGSRPQGESFGAPFEPQQQPVNEPAKQSQSFDISGIDIDDDDLPF